MSYFYMNKFSKNSGFTLIEIMVVIIIITILSAIVLFATSSARNKGADTSIKAQLVSARNQANILFSIDGCYGVGSLCNTVAISTQTCSTIPAAGGYPNSVYFDSKFWSQLNAALSTSGGLSACRELINGSAWAIAIQLKEDTTKAWCVDSVGSSKLETIPSPYGQSEINTVIAGAASRCL